MESRLADTLRRMDWLLTAAVFVIVAIGLVSLASLSVTSEFPFFTRQLVWVALGIVAFLVVAFFDYRIFRNYGGLLLAGYLLLVSALAMLLLFGREVRGVTSWFRIGSFGIEPGEFVKVVLILILAKYFSRRHVEIYRLRHLIISGIYVAIPLVLVLIQPDLGTAAILGMLWFGIVVSAGIKIRHLIIFFVLGIAVLLLGWEFLLAPYQQVRILSFLNPWHDPLGSGYNAIQSMIAVGSGRIFGKGLGYGSQTHLNFLPEPGTDFIFAAFAEEWGFVGVVFLLFLYGILFWRLFRIGMRAGDNFARLVILGTATILFVHLMIHIGMNVGILPITGIPLPFLSYGGSSILATLILLGIVQSIAIRSLKSGTLPRGEGVLS
ncbi:MAG: rod shape-determining protein RodA [Candidatus Sungbacteria bacterium]|nr:rod shape-determining protein RodA [Candidatus Sungbacteria bacterium]